MRPFHKILIFLPLVALFFAVSAHAVVLESGIPGGAETAAGQELPSLVNYIRYLYLFVLGFVGIAGLVTLVIWGTVWTASGVVDKKAAAMEGIKNTLYGIGIALAAYVILYTVNPDLTIIKLPALESIKPPNPIADPWESARRKWVCGTPDTLNTIIATMDWQQDSVGNCGRLTPLGCEQQNPPLSSLCVVEIPLSYLKPGWNCGTNNALPLSRWEKILPAHSGVCGTMPTNCGFLSPVCYKPRPN
ncbi:hypothetical protein A3C91_03700 [Candidatus Azambacteria bacterium RIFCSPHIGHO2_02_FULL_52_12]|uniref:DUF5671 domain-containing protein n=1 Tax=Candidatus Azambacteria bacterium RIFCSPLOWO2_01_FULL_46_25 TaxID=1797298 RepID=A0A1F5BUQ3_9BACT|nr:MAG: hypothetical protein A3C91_03700 [Candidatus Azambacteria bacterium RIFCSPHIGHO2_02_FULL_52_12]OGD34365.1 MAG: hypothetical protein A2988_02450 [Candidatus Azambacteria bacterium RIFCSPLOWO2_01_FULL_46_25]OGD37357.1 MAG: hypothetical protein A2850_01435 [Candidatus Azambacteria bacterium RIFCSPHIGHO2_01_FULL_51_74]